MALGLHALVNLKTWLYKPGFQVNQCKLAFEGFIHCYKISYTRFKYLFNVIDIIGIVSNTQDNWFYSRMNAKLEAVQHNP